MDAAMRGVPLPPAAGSPEEPDEVAEELTKLYDIFDELYGLSGGQAVQEAMGKDERRMIRKMKKRLAKREKAVAAGEAVAEDPVLDHVDVGFENKQVRSGGMCSQACLHATPSQSRHPPRSQLRIGCVHNHTATATSSR